MMDAPLIDIRPSDWQIVRSILEKHVPSYEVWAFGSRARWEAKDYSDLDLAVITDRPLSFNAKSALDSDFAESDLPFKVDVVDWATASPPFREIIQRGKVVVHEGKKRSGPPDEWELAPLNELVDDILDRRGVTPLKLGSDFVSEGYRVISAKLIKNRRIDLSADEPRFVDEFTYRKWMGTPLLADDVIITSEAPLGEVAYVRQPLEWCLGQRLFCIRTKKKRLHGRFLYYALQSEEVVHDLQSRATGTTAQGIRQTELRRVRIPLPSIDEQHAIAHILGTLDDKIELNREMNETLEAMARAIFKSWFVDFEPVRAKMEGRPTGLPSEIEELFPDEMVDSEMGEIPKGWKAWPLPEVIEVNPTRSLRRGESAPYLDMANMPTHVHRPDDVFVRPFGSGMRFINGDTLVARITPCLENGKTAFVDFLEEGQVGWGSTEYIVLRPKPPLPAEFAYCLARNNEFREFAIQSMTGSSGRQRVPAESLSHYLIAVPPEGLAKRFGSTVNTLFARARAAARESRTLATQRDVLLPKLISGELRVKAAAESLQKMPDQQRMAF